MYTLFRFALTLAFVGSLFADVAFTPHVIASGLKGGYQVIAIDMNRDGKPDLIALAPGTNELVWFENPGWQRHVIVAHVAGMINCAAFDIDVDGFPEIALAYGFSNQAAKSLGIVAILRRPLDPSQEWTVQEIDRVPTSHRLRWADVRGDGKKVLINVPLTNADAKNVDDHLAVPLLFYDPADWKRQVISQQSQGVQHGVFVTDWYGEGQDAILTASFSGLHLYGWQRGEHWSREELSSGAPEPWPKGGSSDVAVGRLGRERFLATIEPWHGNQIAVYRLRKGRWHRTVIETGLADGHTILTAPFSPGANESILAGERSGGKSIFLYRWSHGHWKKQTIDEGQMAAASCVAVDLNGDRRVDFACISPVTQTLKWYENGGNQKTRGLPDRKPLEK